MDIASISKERDRAIRLNLLEITRYCLEHGMIEDAKFYGEHSARVKKRIEEHDYSAEDEEQHSVAYVDNFAKQYGILHV